MKVFKNKKAQQLGGLFKYWQYILFAISSTLGVFIIFKFIFQVAFVGYVYPVFVNAVTSSTITPEIQTIILNNYARIPLYISICMFSVLAIVGIYLALLAVRDESENVYR